MAIMKTLTVNGTTYNVVPVVPASSVTLMAAAWEGSEGCYSQVVDIPEVTAHTKVDLQPTSEQLAEFHNKVLAFVAENDDGIVTVYTIGDKPADDYTIQITKTEVIGVGKIRGDTVGTPVPRANLEQNDASMADYVFGRDAFLGKAAPAGYGLGTVGKEISDWNAATLSGFYYGKVNSPDGNWWAGAVYGNGTNYAFQHLYKTSTPSVHKVRELSGGTWGAWIDCGPSAFAPSGYGLGTVGADVSDANQVFDVFRNGWFRTFSTTANTAVAHGAGIALVYDANRALHLLAKTTAGTMRTRYTPNSDGVFVEDLINPPMTAGYEYRTIERWSGKTVYVKVVDFGALPNNTYKAVAHGSSLTKCIRYNLVNKHSSLMLDGHRNILVNVDATNVQITTNTDLSAHQAWCVIWYTKD